MVDTWQHRTMRDVWRVIFSRWLTALVVLAIVLGAAAAATFLLPQVFEGEARLQAPMSPAEQTLSGDIRTDSTWEVRLKMQHDVLTGDTVLSRVLAIAANPSMRRSAVVKRYNWLKPSDLAIPDKVLMETLRRVERNEPQAVSAAAILDKAAADIVASRQDDLTQFRKDLRMEVAGGQQTAKSLSFSIYVRADQAAKAKLLTDLVTEEFCYRYHELLLGELKSRAQAAKLNTDKMRDDVNGDYLLAKKAFETEVNPYHSTAEFLMAASLLNKGPNTDVGTGRNQTEAISSYITLDSQAKGVNVLLNKLQAAVTAFDLALVGDGAEAEDVPFIPEEAANQPAIAELWKNLTVKFVQRAELASKFNDNAQGRYQLLVDVKNDIHQLEKNLLMLFKAEIAGLEARKARLEAELAPYKDFLGDKPAAGSGKFDKLGNTLSNFGEVYNNWQNQLQLYSDQSGRASRALRDYDQAMEGPQLTVTDDAIQPDKPIRPIVWLNLLVGAVVGILLALTYVFLADYYDHSVHSTDDVERYLGLPVLASVGRIGRHPVQPE